MLVSELNLGYQKLETSCVPDFCGTLLTTKLELSKNNFYYVSFSQYRFPVTSLHPEIRVCLMYRTYNPGACLASEYQ